MNHGIMNQGQLTAIERALREKLIESGVVCVILINMAGNTIAAHDNGGCDFDTAAFAALAAGNFAAVDAMARLVGESEFSLLFHKGEKSSIHFSKVNEELLLITMFEKEIALGLVRLKVADTITEINSIVA